MFEENLVMRVLEWEVILETNRVLGKDLTSAITRTGCWIRFVMIPLLWGKHVNGSWFLQNQMCLVYRHYADGLEDMERHNAKEILGGLRFVVNLNLHTNCVDVKVFDVKVFWTFCWGCIIKLESFWKRTNN